jgi:hypothetical protein
MPLRPDRQIFCKVPARFFNRQVNEENAEPIVTHPHSRQSCAFAVSFPFHVNSRLKILA